MRGSGTRKAHNRGNDHPAEAEDTVAHDLLRPLVVGRTTTNVESPALSGGVIVGELIGMTDDGRTPLVVFPGQRGSAAIQARSVLDLHSAHVGGQVVLVFEGADPRKPIIMGLIREERSSRQQHPGHVEVDTDGERMIVSAKTQLVLRCGKASITLTQAGKVLIEGTYVSSRSTGANRLKGGSIHLN
jgi:hypothetical protein